MRREHHDGAHELAEDLRTHAGQVFLEKYGELVNLNHSGQIALRKMLEEQLRRVDWDERQFPIRLFPHVVGTDRSIVIDPAVAFGRPVVARIGVSTETIADRLDAGETLDAGAADYDLARDEVEDAVLYARAA